MRSRVGNADRQRQNLPNSSAVSDAPSGEPAQAHRILISAAQPLYSPLILIGSNCIVAAQDDRGFGWALPRQCDCLPFVTATFGTEQ